MAVHAHRDDIDYNSLHSQPDAVDFYAAISRQPARKNINEARRKRIIKYVIFAAVGLAVLAGVFAAVGTTTNKNDDVTLTTSDVMGTSPELMLAGPGEQQEYDNQAVLEDDVQDEALAQIATENDEDHEAVEQTEGDEDKDEDALLVQENTEEVENAEVSSSSSSSTSASSTYTAPAVFGAIQATPDLFDSSSSTSSTADALAAAPTPIVQAGEQDADVVDAAEDVSTANEPLNTETNGIADDVQQDETDPTLQALATEAEADNPVADEVEEVVELEEQTEDILAAADEKMRKRHFRNSNKNRLVARAFKH